MNNEEYKTHNLEYELFKKSERIILFGGSDSGKSYFLQQLVLRHSVKFKRIIICGSKNDLLIYPETKNITEYYDDSDAESIYDPFKDEEYYKNTQQDKRGVLLILDDLMTEAYNSQIVNKCFSRGRHLNLSILLVLQSYFPTGRGRSILPMLRNSATCQIFFSLRNRSEMVNVSRSIECSKKYQKFFLDLLDSQVYQKNMDI